MSNPPNLWRRREVLTAALGGVAGAAVLSLAGPGARAALAGPRTLAASAVEDEFESLRQKWSDMLTGGTAYDPADPAITPKLAAITDQAQQLWDSMDTSSGRMYLWSDAASTTISAHVTTSYSRLRSMALAFCTHGSPLAGSPALADVIAAALEWMYANRYNENTATYDNWWDWEIGAPGSLNDICCMMYASLPTDRIITYLAVVEKHSPDPTKLHSAYAPKESTGANRVSMCKVVAVRGMVVADPAKLIAVRDALSDALVYTTEKDGMYRDGSYLYHEYIPYNGSYGKDSFEKIGQLVHLLNDTTWEVVDPNRVNLVRWVYDAFAPFLYNGGLMDMIRGREISRDYAQDHVAGHSLISTIVQATDLGAAADELAFKRLVKANLVNDTYRDFFLSASIPAIVAARAILDDPRIAPAAAMVADHQFAVMNRTLSRRTGHAFGISMHSSRIQNYETVNNENLKGWHTADGMTYLYNGDLAHYSDDFWPTVDPQRLAGTTVLQGSTGTTRRFSDKVWVGGSEVAGRYSATGMWLHPFALTLQAKKSWFTFDDEVVALGCDISSTDGAPVETIIESRKLDRAGENAFVVDGATQPAAPPWSATLSEVSWAHLAGHVPGSDIGYFFPDAASVNCLREKRTGTWRAINDRDNTPQDDRTNAFLTMWFDHGVNPTAGSYAYAILPGFSAAETQSYAQHPRFQVLANSAEVQAVTVPTQGVTGLNVWTDEGIRVRGVTVSRRASVMVRRTDETVEVAVADPTHLNRGLIEVELDQPVGGLVSADPNITVLRYVPTLKLAVAVADTQGRTLHATFKRTGAPGTPGIPPQVDVPAEVVVDNGDPGFAIDSTNWLSRKTAGGSFLGADYLIDGGADADPTMWAMWTPYISRTARYDVYLRWATASNGPTAAPLEIAHRGGIDTSHTVDQRAHSGEWVLLGNYELLAGTSNYVKILAASPGYTIADAAKFVRTGA